MRPPWQTRITSWAECRQCIITAIIIIVSCHRLVSTISLTEWYVIGVNGIGRESDSYSRSRATKQSLLIPLGVNFGRQYKLLFRVNREICGQKALKKWGCMLVCAHCL